MRPSLEKLTAVLPPYEDRWIVISRKQTVRDIIREILEAHTEFAGYYDELAIFFEGETTEETCKNIYDFLKRNIKYLEEKEEEQTTALPAGILFRKHGDCKHYSSFAGGILDALNRRGANLKWCYRFASYDAFTKTPHHVFVVVEDQERGEEIWIDPTPGAAKQIPVWLIDKKIKVASMLKRNIAGFNQMGRLDQQMIYVDDMPMSPAEALSPLAVEQIEEQQADAEITAELQRSLEVLFHYGVLNEKGEVSDRQLQELARVLPQEKFDEVASARQALQVAIQQEVAIGSFANIWRGIKKVTLAVPRNAYLSLVAVNAFGMATKLKNAVFNPDGSYWQPGQDKLYKKWYSLGGDWNNLRNAINSGAAKRALLGCVDCQGGETVGAAAAALPAWVAVASALIAAITPLVKSIISDRAQMQQLPANIDPNTGLPYGVNPGDVDASAFDTRSWLVRNPLAVVAIAAAGYFAYTELKKK